jgi:hypothetical protein
MKMKTKKKIYISLTIVVAMTIGCRAILPGVLLRKANKYLSSFSPTYSLHMEDLDISFFRGAYRFESVSGKLKKTDKNFLKIASVDVSIAWREIFKGRILTDIETERLEFLVLTNMNQLSSPKDDANEVKSKLFPIKVARLDLKNAELIFEEYANLNVDNHFRISDINGSVTNLTADKTNQISNFNLSAAIFSSPAFKFTGELNTLQNPMRWDLNGETKDFDLTLLNPFLKRHIPLTFTTGKIDIYSEAKSTDGKVKGYIKPFFKEVDVVSNHEHFKGIKHFAYEVVAALSNLILRERKTKSVATIIEFNYDQKLEIKTDKSLLLAIKHGFNQPLKNGSENKYQLE